ncbi:MAG TPA: lamin tail domain-containing protein [Candidatus Limnocylindria bacterium]|nr:lamin tail domain-containing protein [Candidatus Limnocylindria bacterium]
MRHAPSTSARRGVGAMAMAGLVLASVISETAQAAPTADGLTAQSIGHVVVSEVMTGGAGASDEFVELYNPEAVPLSLDGLELVYVTASGVTVTRKAAWGPGAEIGPGGHVLVANEAGLFAGIADLVYVNGLAATGGSMALRVVGAEAAIDAVGWGSATSTWLEGDPAPAPAAGSSLERLPGGELGSGQDTDQNLVDFVIRSAPDPQNGASAPVPSASPSQDPSPSDSPTESATPAVSVEPSATPEPTSTPIPPIEPSATPEPPATPSATAIPSVTPSPTSIPTPTPTPATLTVAQARAMPDGSAVVVRGTTLTDSAFADGGGYLADVSGGIAVLLEDGTFPRGVEIIVTGTVDDRFAQRTLRVDAASLSILGPGEDFEAMLVATGAVNEGEESRLVTISGLVAGSPTVLAAGLAYDVDDGSGPIRVLVGPATGIDTSAWLPGSVVTTSGVVGQRDSSGTGTEGYRVQPRDSGDVLAVAPPATPEPTASPSATSPTPTPTPSPDALVSIAEARAAPTGTRLRIRGVVTLPTGLVDASSAVVADAGGAILVRTGSEVGRLRRGQLVELTGTRSTLSGMVSLRVTQRPAFLGTQAEPAAVRQTTSGVGEADEARLVVVRGLVDDGPRRTTGGGLTLTVNDGSGPLRVFVAAATGITAPALPSGSWVEIRGVVGQQTSGSAPDAGYRLWPRDRADLQVVARAAAGVRGSSSGASTGGPGEPRTQPDGLSAPPAIPSLKTSDLGGAAARAPSVLERGTSDGAGRTAVPPIPVPLAAGLGGLAGLLALAWRHGTWARLRGEIEERMGGGRTTPHDGGEDESYTLAR